MLASEREGGDGRIKRGKLRFYYAHFKEEGRIRADKNEENAILLCSSKQKMGKTGG